MEALYQELRDLFPTAGIRWQEPMSRHTTFRIGGPARIYGSPRTQEDLLGAVGLCRKRAVPWSVVGCGSNLLVGDEGYEGVIVSTELLDGLEVRGKELRASAGARLARLAKAAAESSLTGMEFAAGIPGTLGGAVVMNAGAYGSELKDVLVWAKVLDRGGQIRRLDREELRMGYRASCVCEEGYVVLEACLGLLPGERPRIYEKMEELARRRKEKQPLEYPSAGSMFKRPPGYFAGKLIDDAGLRGYRVGGAQVSEKHCGFVVNTGEATAADVLALCEEIRSRVAARFGVDLEMEVRRL